MQQKPTDICMKCGREIDEGAAFCAACLEDMATHPVAPETPVQILPQPAMPAKRPPARRIRRPEEQVRSLRKAVIWLSAALAVALIAAAVAVAMFIVAKNGADPKIIPDFF